MRPGPARFGGGGRGWADGESADAEGRCRESGAGPKRERVGPGELLRQRAGRDLVPVGTTQVFGKTWVRVVTGLERQPLERGRGQRVESRTSSGGRGTAATGGNPWGEAAGRWPAERKRMSSGRSGSERRPAVDAGGSERRGEPEPERSSRRPQRRSRTEGHLGGWTDGADREPPARVPTPLRADGRSSDRPDGSEGAGRPNPMDVSG